jgi:hypothetical protein
MKWTAVRISCSLTLTMKVRVMIMAMIGVSEMTVTDANMLVSC